MEWGGRGRGMQLQCGGDKHAEERAGGCEGEIRGEQRTRKKNVHLLCACVVDLLDEQEPKQIRGGFRRQTLSSKPGGLCKFT